MNMNLTAEATQEKPKLFYGWVVVMAATLIYGIMGGPIICFGIFIKPMAQEFAWSRTLTTGAFFLYIIFTGSFGIVSGLLVDRIGPKLLSVVGSIVYTLGLILCSQANNVVFFYLGFGVCVGIGFSCMFVPLQATLSRWFVEKRGLALGIMFAGGGAAGLILSPLLQLFIDNYNWRTAFVFLIIMVLCITLPAAMFLRKNPEAMGLMPLGSNNTESKIGKKVEAMSQAQEFSVKEATKTAAFWMLNVAIILMFMGIFMAQVNMVPHATDKGIPAATAALALGLAAAFNAIGRLSMGALSDKIGTKKSYGICLGLGSIMLFFLIFVRTPWMMYLFAILFGFAYGGSVPLLPRLASEIFGLKSIGGILGLISLMVSLGPALGPVLGSAIYDQTGSYSNAFVAGGIAIFIALMFIFLMKTQRTQN